VRVRQKGRAKVCKKECSKKEGQKFVRVRQKGRTKVCKSVAIKKCGKKDRNNC
jgi:hypothetical protein